MRRQLPALLLTLCMVCTMLGGLTITARAAETSGVLGDNGSWSFDKTTGTLTISGSGKMDFEYYNFPWYDFREDVKAAVISNGFTTIQNNLFRECSNMTSVTIPNSVTTIEYYAFYCCTSLTSVVIPDSVTYIGNEAFAGCESLSSLTMGNHVSFIGTGAFAACSALTEVTIPASAASMAEDAFSNCESLTAIHVDSQNEKYCDVEGVLFDKSATELIQYPGGRRGVYIIPRGVVTIKAYSFSNCQGLTAVTIPDSVTTIEEHAFYNTGLTSVVIPGSVKTISESVFYSNENLASVTISEGVTVIGDNAFSMCDALSSVTLPRSLTTIGAHAFSYSGALTSVTIPAAVTAIGESAFDCYNLTHVHFLGDKPSFDDPFGGWNPYKPEVTLCYLTGKAGWEYDYQTRVWDCTVKTDGCLTTYTCNGCGETVKEMGLVDLKAGEYYVEPVTWAVENGITNGTDKTHFSPEDPCTRAQIVTFLWRAMGSPKPTSSNNPFTDVPSGEYYTDAVLWAVEKGITTGTSKTTFSPDEPCTRGQVVTFQYRAKGKPAVSGTCAFTDVVSGEYYYDAVIWAVGGNITTGTDKTHFSPDDACTRGQIVTFLYRDLAKSA